ASTDMSHYYVYGKACLMDGLTLRLLEEYNIEGLINNVGKGDCELCGMAGVITLMESCKTLGANKIKLLNYANSGDVTGNKNRVVGYSSLVVSRHYSKTELTKKKELKSSQRGKKMLINESQKEKLLKIARLTLETYLTTKNKPDFQIEDEILKEKRGTFVTLHKNDKLRGCIGNMVGQKALWKTVRDMVIESALNDSRFSPVTKEELNQIDIEISVLTPLERVDDVEKIIMGKHGVIIKKGFRQGVFLPQVADETGWSREEFLSALCSHKAGLPVDAWKDKDVEIYIFSAQVFGEKDKN
ncbi:AmmeMemoRadiSam system protein A, partial [bacterium]|nr:AmmeMemoRadiSam system protein A [bacterium]